MLSNKIKYILAELSYRLGVICIMSDAMEFSLDPDVVDKFLEANYKNYTTKVSVLNEE